MNYPAGLFVRVLYSLSLLGLLVAIGLAGSSWIALVLGGSSFGGIRSLACLGFVLYRIVQVFRNPHALSIHAPNPLLRFLRGVALFLMFTNVLLIGAAIFVGPITKWFFRAQSSDNGIEYFVMSLLLIAGLFLTCSGVVLFEIVRLSGNSYKRSAGGVDPSADNKSKQIFGMKFNPLLTTLALIWVSSYFIPTGGLDAQAISNLAGPSAPPRFNEVCKKTGVNILSAPQQEVRSIYLVHSPHSDDGRFKYPIHDTNRIGPQYWESDFFPELAVDSPYADVVVSYDADDKDAAGGPLFNRKLVRYIVTATDRRNGQVLGTMSYATDFSTGYGCGANTSEGIDVNAFLRKVTVGHGESIETKIPISKASAELVSSEAFSPAKVYGFDRWNDELQYGSMAARCDAMLPKIGPSRRRFADATHGLRFMQDDTRAELICLNTGIFRVTNIAERDHQPIQVDKYTVDGRHLYALQVSTSNSPNPENGFVVEKNFGAEDGFLHFEKWKSEQQGNTRVLDGVSKYRVTEPQPLEETDSPTGTDVPEWATYFREEDIEVEKEFSSDANSTIDKSDMAARTKDLARRTQCGQIAPEDPKRFRSRRFAADATGTAEMDELGIADLCNDQGIWSMGKRYDQLGEVFIVQKYSPAGVLKYKVKFRANTEGDNETSVFLAEPSLSSKNGYLHVELWYCREIKSEFVGPPGSGKYQVLRHVAVRIKEPPL